MGELMLVENLDLPNTLALPAVAEHGLRIDSVNQLQALLAEQSAVADSLLVLGGGSNVVLPPSRPGVTLLMRIKGIVEVRGAADERTFEVGAGESWQGFVRFCLGQGLGGGIENLSLIPGTVGAAPIQNIGAYGVEVAEFTRAVQVIDRHDLRAEPLWLGATECDFGYRDSRFKRCPDRWVITAVRFGIRDSAEQDFRLGYAGITEELARMGDPGLSATLVAEAVSRTRRAKLPDPRRHPNAGSFFKNPVLERRQLAQLVASLPATAAHRLREVPNWPQGKEVKLAAAALIERCGFKREPGEHVQVWYRQPLVLVNRGRADAQAVLGYARLIRERVEQQFGIGLEQEPIALD